MEESFRSEQESHGCEDGPPGYIEHGVDGEGQMPGCLSHVRDQPDAGTVDDEADAQAGHAQMPFHACLRGGVPARVGIGPRFIERRAQRILVNEHQPGRDPGAGA
ncbi:MAG: hypothetical protein QM703_07385 [Gemmatales bacterium]